MPWGDGTGPWWQGRRSYGTSGYMMANPWCRGRRMHPGRGFWQRDDLAYPRYSPVRELSPSEEMGRLEDLAKRMELDLKGVRDQIEKLRSSK